MSPMPTPPVNAPRGPSSRRWRYPILTAVFFILGAGHACRLGSWATVDSFDEWHPAPVTPEVEDQTGTAYFYQASWFGISLGEAVFGSRQFAADADVRRFFFEARDIGVARLFSGRWTRLESTLAPTLEPHRLIVRQERSDVLRERVFEYPRTEAGELRCLMRDGSIKPPPPGCEVFIDPLAAVHQLRRVEFEPGLRTQILTAGGLRFFELTFSCVALETIEWKGNPVHTAVVQVDYTEISPDGTRDEVETAGRVWIGKDEERILYRADYYASILAITIELDRIERAEPSETRFLY